MTERRKFEEKNLNEENFRYASSEKILELTIDRYPIFLDRHDRIPLGVLQPNPIRVRRDLVKAFFEEIREFVAVFVLSLIAVLEFASQLKPLKEIEPYHWIIAVSVIMVASSAFSAIRIWPKIK